jgi:hypothetical protein
MGWEAVKQTLLIADWNVITVLVIHNLPWVLWSIKSSTVGLV